MCNSTITSGDITTVLADAYPCRAAGYTRTLDADRMHGGEHVAGCLTGPSSIRNAMGKISPSRTSVPLNR